MYIYIDVVIILNIVMNSIILLLTAWAAGIEYQLWRLFLAAALGGVYVLGGISPALTFFYSGPIKLLMSFIIILVSFGIKPLRVLCLLVGIFFIISFVLGGAVLGWFYFWQSSHYWQGNYLDLSSISWDTLAGGILVGVILVLIVAKRMVARMSRRRTFYGVTIEYAGRSVGLTGMLDTGNGLYTVVGRKPVVLVNWGDIEPLLSGSVVQYLRKTEPELWLVNLECCMDEIWLSRIQPIPYQSVGSRNMLLGFRPDKISITISKNECIVTNDVVVGIYNGSLASDGSYVALLHPALINSNEKEEAGKCA